MVKIVKKMGDFPFAAVMAVYAESNAGVARERWPELNDQEGLFRAELDFYQYLRHDFFTMGDSFYALWLEGETAVSALRLERWRDGWLLEGLETHPEFRRRGYAARLMDAALETVEGKVYAHVARDNLASLGLHEKCGFRASGVTAMVDGSYLPGYVTMVRE